MRSSAASSIASAGFVVALLAAGCQQFTSSKGGNHPPSAVTVAIVPEHPLPGDLLQAVVLAGSWDAEGDTVSYEWSWYRDGSLESTWDGPMVGASLIAKGETWKVVVRPHDGEDHGPATSASVEVQDSAGDDDSGGLDQDGDGYTPDEGDCDDQDPTTYPGALERCDGKKNNCDGAYTPAFEDGIVTFVTDDGLATDYTEAFAAGTEDAPVEICLDVDGTLTLCEGVYFARLWLEAAEIAVAGLDGSQPAVLDAAFDGPVIEQRRADAHVRIEQLTLTHGQSGNGGGIDSLGGELHLSRCRLLDNAAEFSGAGVRHVTGDVLIEDCSIHDNAVLEIYYGGGGIHLGSGTLTISGSSFDDNLATHGAAVEMSGDLAISNSTFTGNRAKTSDGGLGGAIRVEGGSVSIVGSTFEDNVAEAGGAIWAWNADVSIDASLLQMNSAATGGAVYLYDGDLICMGQAPGIFGFFANAASGNGGAVWSNGSVVSDLCDWGFMADSNLPHDIDIDDTVFVDYDDDASFTCTAQGCTP
jgi:Right handed beta helix region/Putative metal-binding motif